MKTIIIFTITLLVAISILLVICMQRGLHHNIKAWFLGVAPLLFILAYSRAVMLDVINKSKN